MGMIDSSSISTDPESPGTVGIDTFNRIVGKPVSEFLTLIDGTDFC